MRNRMLLLVLASLTMLLHTSCMVGAAAAEPTDLPGLAPAAAPHLEERSALPLAPVAPDRPLAPGGAQLPRRDVATGLTAT
jgi:hypothetical protein